MRTEMENKRKPLSDVTNIHNLTPLSVLRELVASNEISKPPISILKPNSNYTSNKLCSEPSEKSNTSIGSSSVGARFNSKTVQSPHSRLAVCSITSSACNRRQNAEKTKKVQEANVVVSSTPVEKEKGKGKATSVPSSSFASDKMKDIQNQIYNSAQTADGVRIQKTVGFSIPKEKHPDLLPETNKKPRKRVSDATDCQMPIMKRKPIPIAHTSSRTRKLKDIENNISISNILAEERYQKDVDKLGFSRGSVEKVKDNKDMLFHSHASGKANKGRANLNFSDHALGKISEIEKNAANTSCCLLEKRNDKDKEISKQSISSIVQIKEKGEEYRNTFTSSVGRAKSRGESWNTSNSLPDKTKGKEKVNHELSNIGVSSPAMAVKSRLFRKTSVKNKNDIGLSSCPPMMKSQRIKNDLDEARDVKSLDSWTDPQAKHKKKRGDKSNEWPEDFIREKKAYYEDIDNFELAVEEVSSQDELD